MWQTSPHNVAGHPNAGTFWFLMGAMMHTTFLQKSCLERLRHKSSTCGASISPLGGGGEDIVAKPSLLDTPIGHDTPVLKYIPEAPIPVLSSPPPLSLSRNLQFQ